MLCGESWCHDGPPAPKPALRETETSSKLLNIRAADVMNRSVTDTPRALIAVALILGAREQSLCAQDAPPAPSSDAAPVTTMFSHDESTSWWLSGQINLIEQAHGAFPTRYSGPHSFLATPEWTLSRVLTLYTGLRVGRGWEALVDIESAEIGRA